MPDKMKQVRTQLGRFPRSAAKIRRADGHTEGWRVVERYCANYRVSLDMHDIVEDLYQRATIFMHDSCVRMDGDSVGKPQNFLPCAIRIT